MGCTVRDKHIKAVRRTRSVKPETESSATAVVSEHIGLNSNQVMESEVKELDCLLGLSKPSENPDLNVSPDGGWGYCTEDQLEDFLWEILELLYNEAIAKLVALGHDEDVALKAILSNGYCYGRMDVLTNIVQNSLAYLNSGGSEPVFTNLRLLAEYSLVAMISLLQQIKPQLSRGDVKHHLSRGDAMRCLLMSDLDVVRASMMEVPVLPSSVNGTSVPNVALQ